MNKKFSTLMAVAMLATGVNGWAQDFAKSETVVNTTDGNYTVQGGTTDAPFTDFKVDNTSWDARFPKVSPYALSIANGAKPISKLNKTDGTADGRYFQIAVGDAGAKGKELLTMIFNKRTGKNELQIENVENANVNGSLNGETIKGIHLDRTLWEVRVNKDKVGTTLYYTLINKSTQMTLQIPQTGTPIKGEEDFQEVPVTVEAGQTDWRWAKGETATQASVIESAAGVVLKDQISAQFTNGNTIYLAKKVEGAVTTLCAVIANSNTPFTSVAGDDATYTPITFEAWEANPVVLTAEQINAELGNDKILTESTPGYFNFSFTPDVVGDENTMVGSNFIAEAPKKGWERIPGDAPDGFVRFKLKADESKYLRVDTNYYDSSANNRFDLKMTVDKIIYPRHAVLADGLGVDANGRLLDAPNGRVLTNDEIYATGTSVDPAKQSAIAVAQLRRQGNFRPIYYPSTMSLRLQAEMIYKADKSATPWWMQMAVDAGYASDNEMVFAPCSTDPAINTTTVANVKGYYPATSQKSLAGVLTHDATMRVIHYEEEFEAPLSTTPLTSTYKPAGTRDANAPLWNAIGNLYVADPAAAATDMLVADPANATKLIFNNLYALAHSNVVKLVTLTSSHKVLTADIHDITDATYNGLLTFITIERQKTYDDVAEIPNGFYYIANANKVSTQLLKNGEYRYEDLAATNASFAYWNAMLEKWAVAFNDAGVAANDGINVDYHRSDLSNNGNIVYSVDKKEIPSAQFYISGNGGHFAMTNRESGRQWQTSYWWKTSEPNVYVNMATFTDGAGMSQSYRDTIRIEAVPATVLANKTAGYLNISQAVAKADTSVYNFKFTSLGDVELFLSQAPGTDSILKVMKETPGKYKLEKVRVMDKDIYSQVNKDTADLFYGITDKAANQLERAKYYIYKDEVSSNSGVETTGIRYREYITLEGGKYRMTKVKVNVDADGFTKHTDTQVLAGSKADNRRAFYVKQISTVNPDQYVLVDPMAVVQNSNNTGVTYNGARAFANQLTAEVQPAGLISSASANAFDNSVFAIEKIQAYNYRDIRAEGVDRDTVEFFKAGSSDYLLSENNKVAGANTGLLEIVSSKYGQNNALFLDTANVSETEFPRFLIGLRSVDSTEVSNVGGHNHHLQTTADYLVNLVDSAAVNAAYRYRNIDQNVENEYYRLGFLTGVHKGTNLTMAKDGKVFDLSGKGNAGMNYATFAFRFADAARDNFYIETVYKNAQKGWLKSINNVLVVTNKIQEAEVFQVNKATTAPTDNEGIETTEVSVIAGVGSVTINNAAGKTVAISNILGQAIANTVITSDNATIAVPAGIVVVSVEGEAAVKAIVK